LEKTDVNPLAPGHKGHPEQGGSGKTVIDPPDGDLRPLWLGDHRQVFWIELDGPRTPSLEELRGGVLPGVEAGDPLGRQVPADGDTGAYCRVQQPQHGD
jgi:hypothetical protein